MEDTLFEACQMVLHDPTVEPNVLTLRAKGLKIMAETYQVYFTEKCPGNLQISSHCRMLLPKCFFYACLVVSSGDSSHRLEICLHIVTL